MPENLWESNREDGEAGSGVDFSKMNLSTQRAPIGNGGTRDIDSHLLNGEEGCRRLYRVWAVAPSGWRESVLTIRDSYTKRAGRRAGLWTEEEFSSIQEGAALCKSPGKRAEASDEIGWAARPAANWHGQVGAEADRIAARLENPASYHNPQDPNL